MSLLGRFLMKLLFSDPKTSQLQKETKSISQMNKEISINIRSKSATTILTNLIAQIKNSRSSYVKPKHQNDLLPAIYKDIYGEQHFTGNFEDSAISSLNSSIRLKYYLQWVLVIFLHFVVFWFLPSKSNYATQQKYY